MQIEQMEKKKDGMRKRMQSSPSPTKRMKIEQEAPVGEALPSGGDKKGGSGKRSHRDCCFWYRRRRQDRVKDGEEEDDPTEDDEAPLHRYKTQSRRQGKTGV